MDPALIDQALAELKKDYGDFKADRENGNGVVTRLRGSFLTVADAPTFPETAVKTALADFWARRGVLFDPNQPSSAATVLPFVMTAKFDREAHFVAQQKVTIGGTQIDFEGALLRARFALRPATSLWQLDLIESSLIEYSRSAENLLIRFVVSGEAERVEKAASLAVFGRSDLVTVGPQPVRRSFAATGEAVFCWRIAFPAQPRIQSKSWGRGAIVYWPFDPSAIAPLHIEPDGRYAVELANQTGPYHPAGVSLWVTPVNGSTPQCFELVDDSFATPARKGPILRTVRLNRLERNKPLASVLSGTEWKHLPNAPSRSNPGVAADVHAFAHATVDYFLNARDRAHFKGKILPDEVNIAVHAFPAAQPGEWRKSSNTAVIANADDSLPPSWMKRWDYCCAHDVVAHELGHGVLNEFALFEYSLESGALEEGLADLLAILASEREEIFVEAWCRERTPFAPTEPWLRNATWTGKLVSGRLTPSELAERGRYPNHYAQFARLAKGPAAAIKRSRPSNGHGYVHWNCAILTRALAVLARPAGQEFLHPESGLPVHSIGRLALEELVFATIFTLGRAYFSDAHAITPFARWRAAMLEAATSTKFDDTKDRRRYATRLLGAFNAAGIGPVLSVTGRPAGVPSDFMPRLPQSWIPDGALDWIAEFRQGAVLRKWKPGDGRVALDRKENVKLRVRVANLGVSQDRSPVRLSVLVEKGRTDRGTSIWFEIEAAPSNPIASGEGCEIEVEIPNKELPGSGFDTPWVGLVATNAWNALRQNQMLRDAVADTEACKDPRLPLNVALLRLQLS